MTAFARFPPRLQEAIVSRLGWTSLRPVQELAGEAILDGKNAVVLAPTAGGKTEASMFPALANLIEREPDGVGVLYIAPMKALLNNQEDRLGAYAEMVGLRRFVWHGDVGDAARRAFVRDPAEILMTTPESLEVMLVSPRAPVPRLFKDLRLVVIDEVHAMAGTDRGAHLMSVLERIVPASQNDVQRVGLSATVGNPEEILAWLKGSSRREGVVVDPPWAPAKRDLAIGLHESVSALADRAAARAAGKKSLFFCQSRALTEAVAERMRGCAVDVFVHHSSVSLEERRAAEDRFAHGSNACIVCTSTLELGIDVGDLDAVLQANAPSTVSSFMQRMGRTGRRAGTVANTTFLCEDPEAVLQAVALVELAREGWVERVATLDRCWPVLVHQLLAMTLQHGAVSADRCWEQLSRVPDFRGIGRDELDAVVDHMKREGFLFEAGGLLSMGEKAEKRFGKKNFLELCAVFSTPVLYRVVTHAKRDIGSLEQAFVDRLVEQMSSFLLGGRAWTVDRVSHEDRHVVVQEAPRGTKPAWGGYLPQHLGFEVSQRVGRVITETVRYPYVDEAGFRHITEKRDDLGDLLRRPGAAIQLDGVAAHWWTFAGGRVNHTLKYGFEVLEGWKAVADNFQLRIEGGGINHESVRRAIGRMATAAFWEEPDTRRAVLARLPGYRLSKFQDCLPERFALEVVENFLLDVPGTARWLAGIGAVPRPMSGGLDSQPRRASATVRSFVSSDERIQAMYGRAREVYSKALGEIRDAGLEKRERFITTPQAAAIKVAGGEHEVLNFCANNYLGLSSHPKVIEAAKRAIDRYGYGLSSVRFICGTQDAHKTLEAKVSAFFGTDDAILYSSCFDANGGLFETILGEDDAIISDALNHASIIDGIRLCKAERHRYANGNMEELEAALVATKGKRLRMIATDGVFSMDGCIAKLDRICDLADKYEALVMVDDSHATGFVGKTGRGTPEHCGVMGRVDVITSTLGKALGGAAGGFTTGRREIVDLLRQRSRPYLFSNTVAPVIVGASIAVFDLIGASTDLRDKLMANALLFRRLMTEAGFTIKEGFHPIVPVMLGDARLAADMAAALLTEGIYVVGFSFPVVPKGEARIRVQLSAAHSEEQVKRAAAAFAKVGKAVGVLKG